MHGRPDLYYGAAVSDAARSEAEFDTIDSASVRTSITALAVVAGLVELVVVRGVLPVATHALEHEAALQLSTLGRFLRNVAALLVAAALGAFVKASFRDTVFPLGLVRRVVAGGFAVVVLSVLAVAAVLPDDRLNQVLLLASVLTTYLAHVVLAGTAFDREASRAVRFASVWLGVYGGLAIVARLADVVARFVPDLGLDGVVRPVQLSLELLFLGLPVAAAAAHGARRGRAEDALFGLLVAAGTALALRVAAGALPADFPLLVYRLTHFEWVALLPRAASIAAVSAFLGLTAYASRGSGVARHLALGCLAALVAGVAPGSALGVAFALLAAVTLGVRPTPVSAD